MNQHTTQRMVQVGLDVLSTIAAWRLTYLVIAPVVARETWNGSAQDAIPLFPVVAIWLVVGAWLGVYHTPLDPDRWDRLRSAGAASVSLGFVVCVLAFLAPVNFGVGSRRLALVAVGLAGLLFVMTRMLVSVVGRWWSRNEGSVAVLGSGSSAVTLLEQLRRSSDRPVRGLIVPEGREVRVESAPVIGTTTCLAEVINRQHLERIVIVNGALTQHELEACAEVTARMGVTMSCAMPVAAEPKQVSYSTRFGVTFVDVAPVEIRAVDRILKRAFDIVASAGLLLILSPVLAAITILVKVTSPGPIFYKAARVGRGGRYFTFLKFRSMRADTDRSAVKDGNEKQGHIFKMRNDPRVTPFGRFIRRYSLDELPQLVNVLLGDMSLVGPRPLPIEDLDPDGMSSRFTIWSEQRASVPPGITGLWQIRGRSELPFTDLIRYDLEYVHNWSLALDLKILVATPRFVVSAKGAF